MKTIIEPFRIKSVESLRKTTAERRQHLLRQCGYNLFLLAASDILIDLLTDSGTSALSINQWAAMMRGDESYAGSDSFCRMGEAVQRLTGFRHVNPPGARRRKDPVHRNVQARTGGSEQRTFRFIREREPGYADWTPRRVAERMFRLADGCTFSAKKGAFASIGGFLCTNDDKLAQQEKDLLILTEGFPTYGGLAGRDLEAIATGIDEVLDSDYLEYRIASTGYLGCHIVRQGVPIVEASGGGGPKRLEP